MAEKAATLGVSLGLNDKEIASSINVIKDTEVDRIMVMLEKTAASRIDWFKQSDGQLRRGCESRTGPEAYTKEVICCGGSG